MARSGTIAWGAWIKGFAGVSIAVGIGFAALYSQPLPRDKDLCLRISEERGTRSSEAAQHILILDKTDKWTSAQESRLRALILRQRDQLGVNDRLSIFVFSDLIIPGMEPVFSRCNPGRGSDVSFLNRNPRKLEHEFLQSFGTPLDNVLADLTKAEEAPLSPILEALTEITNREEFTRQDVIERRIILVSDMLQNSDAYTFFPKPVLMPPPKLVLPQPMGGPGPLELTLPKRAEPKAPQAPPKYRTPEIRKMKSPDIEKMVNSKGGLRHLRKFRIEVYQIRGKYSDEKLTLARQFWDLVGEVYGAKIEWKVL